MREYWKKLWGVLPAILAFALLLVQIAIPWTVPHFVTQDGPSYVYNAVVAKKVLLHQQPYASIYRMNPRLVPSWASTILFGLSGSIAGEGHAEQLIMSFALCLGFFSLSYAIRSLSPKALPFTPLSNFVLQTWLLWIGFYNFYLGMVLIPFFVGFYIRRNGKLTIPAAAMLAAGLVILFFAHLLAAAVSVLALAILAIWLHIVRPVLWTKSADSRADTRQLLFVLAAAVPVIALSLIYTYGANGGIPFQPNVVKSWHEFPMHAFFTTDGMAGGQSYLWPAILGVLIIAVPGMRRYEWRTAKAAVAITGVVVFLMYLIVPDSGLGGNRVKVRFAWAVFLFGVLLIASVERLQALRTPLAIFVAACVAFNLASTMRSVAAYSKAVDQYLSALTGIRPGSMIIRIRYPTPDVPDRYRFAGLGRDPLLHLDAYAAARMGYVDLSDYQAASTDFPVIFNPKLDHDQQFELLGLENPQQSENATLDLLLHDFPVSIDYAIVMADGSTPANSAVGASLAILGSDMRSIARSPAPSFVGVYGHIDGR